MVVVPNVLPEIPPVRKNPVFLYQQDNFQRPNPFRPDVAVDIDDVWAKKVAALDSHVSQFYEWLPWVDGILDTVPKDPEARRKWLSEQEGQRPSEPVRAGLAKWYGADRAGRVQHAEAFEICEYGRQPNDDEIRRLFPMLGR
jgi:hypothetical protein